MSLTWTVAYATDVPEIDDQHRGLFDILNDLGEHLGNGDTPKQMQPILDRFARYTREHFVFEEKLMERHNCPTQQVNKLAHDRFRRMIDDAVRQAHAQSATRDHYKKLHVELEQWLAGHVQKIDRKLRESIPKPVGV